MHNIQSSLKSILFELLKDKEVQENIKEIAALDKKQEDEYRKKIEELEAEKRVLQHQLDEARIECERLHVNCRILEKDKFVLEQEKGEVQESMDELTQQFQNHKKAFEPLEELGEIWKDISTLDKSQKDFLKNLCGSWNIKSFIALGKDKNGIKQLWKYIKDEIMNANRKPENIRILANFFDLCIGVYNITNIRKEHYEKLDAVIGEEYDSRQYIKTSESIVNGVVQEVLLNGYSMQDDVMKPIVMVGTILHES